MLSLPDVPESMPQTWEVGTIIFMSQAGELRPRGQKSPAPGLARRGLNLNLHLYDTRVSKTGLPCQRWTRLEALEIQSEKTQLGCSSNFPSPRTHNHRKESFWVGCAQGIFLPEPKMPSTALHKSCGR